MRQLLLLRHAKSSWDDAQMPDRDRPLNVRGRRAAVAMRQAMRDLGLAPDVVLVTLKTPLAAASLDFDRVLILPRHRFPRGDLSRSSDATEPVGTGPMRFGSWTRGVQITLTRNDEYWGPKAPLASLVPATLGPFWVSFQAPTPIKSPSAPPSAASRRSAPG